MLIKVCMYSLILEDDKGGQKKVTNPSEVKKIIEDVYFKDNPAYRIEDIQDLEELARDYGYYVISRRGHIIKCKWGDIMQYDTIESEKQHLISLMDFMIGLTKKEKSYCEKCEIEELEKKYNLLMKEKTDEQLE